MSRLCRFPAHTLSTLPFSILVDSALSLMALSLISTSGHPTDSKWVDVCAALGSVSNLCLTQPGELVLL